MEQVMEAFLDRGELFLPVVVAGSILIGMVIKAITTILTTGTRERTKREIAAYVAEGSMTPEQAERILRPGDGRRR
jgi:hypothetical protein